MSPTSLRQETWRKVVHVSTAVLPAWIYWAPWPWTWRGPLLAFLGVLAVDGARLALPDLGRWFDARFGPYLREHESRGVVAVHALTGAALVLALVAPPAIAATALAYVVGGDASAALVGRRFGRHRLGAKSLEGSLACFAVCLGVGALLVPGRPIAALAGALAATVVEALPLPVDDNWSVPLVGAATLLVLS